MALWCSSLCTYKMFLLSLLLPWSFPHLILPQNTRFPCFRKSLVLAKSPNHTDYSPCLLTRSPLSGWLLSKK